MRRLRFRVLSRTEFVGGITVKMVPLSDGHTENSDFWSGAFNGELLLTVTDSDKVNLYPIGSDHFIEISSVDS